MHRLTLIIFCGKDIFFFFLDTELVYLILLAFEIPYTNVKINAGVWYSLDILSKYINCGQGSDRQQIYAIISSFCEFFFLLLVMEGKVWVLRNIHMMNSSDSGQYLQLLLITYSDQFLSDCLLLRCIGFWFILHYIDYIYMISQYARLG